MRINPNKTRLNSSTAFSNEILPIHLLDLRFQLLLYHERFCLYLKGSWQKKKVPSNVFLEDRLISRSIIKCKQGLDKVTAFGTRDRGMIITSRCGVQRGWMLRTTVEPQGSKNLRSVEDLHRGVLSPGKEESQEIKSFNRTLCILEAFLCLPTPKENQRWKSSLF